MAGTDLTSNQAEHSFYPGKFLPELETDPDGRSGPAQGGECTVNGEFCYHSVDVIVQPAFLSVPGFLTVFKSSLIPCC